jgi:hypothetical protein
MRTSLVLSCLAASICCLSQIAHAESCGSAANRSANLLRRECLASSRTDYVLARRNKSVEYKACAKNSANANEKKLCRANVNQHFSSVVKTIGQENFACLEQARDVGLIAKGICKAGGDLVKGACFASCRKELSACRKPLQEAFRTCIQALPAGSSALACLESPQRLEGTQACRASNLSCLNNCQTN